MRTFIIILCLILVYQLYKVHERNASNISYLRSVGIPDNIIKQMSREEIKAASEYLNQYTKTKTKISNNIIDSIRLKYKIFI